jgi:hypothetical protein
MRIGRTVHSWFEVVVSGLALATLGAVLARAAFLHTLAEVAPINAGDFLISYSGGFVRRGLVGTVLYLLPLASNPHAVEIAIKALSLTTYCASFTLLAAAVHRHTRSASATLLVVLQPFLFGFPVLTGQWVREDFLLLVGFYLCLRWIAGGGAMRGWRWLPVNLVSIAAIAAHEAYGVAMLPVLMLVAASRDDPARHPWTGSVPRALAAFAPSVAALLVMSAFPGDAVVSRGIEEAWRARGILLTPDTTPALFGLNHHGVWRMGFDIVRSNYADKPFFFLFWGGVILAAGVLVSLAGGLARAAYDRTAARESAVIVGIAAAAFAPLFLMATDFGRWVFLWLAVSSGVVFSQARHDVIVFVDRALPRGLPGMIAAPGRAVPGRPRVSRSWCVGLLAASLFCVPLPAYVMEGCCTLRYVMSFSLVTRLVRLVLG